MKRKTSVPPWLTKYQSKPMPHVYQCSVCDERSKVGRRRLTKNGIAFICGSCLRKALMAARSHAANLSRLRDAENIIKSKTESLETLRNAEETIRKRGRWGVP